MEFKENYIREVNNIELPVERHRKHLLYLLDKHRVVIVGAETGSGKSTKIPQILFSAGKYNNETENGSHRMIVVSQPRRVAAVQLAQRVADDMNCNVGATVGFAIRFEDVSSSGQTMIKFVTEGLLVREILSDPLLLKYSIIIIDEAHERNLNTDILLGALKCILLRREDLRLIICSATLDVDKFYRFFSYDQEQYKTIPVPGVLLIPGKTHQLKIFYRKEPVPNYMDSSVETAIEIHERNCLAEGKILIFLTGQDEVEYVCDRLSTYAQTTASRLDIKRLLVLPLHASLKPDEVTRIFESCGKNARVCIVSTNLAETSLTIDKVGFVIDCGFVKYKVYDPRTGFDSLVRVPISKSTAKQRAGRAGRTMEGVVYRLYPEDEYEKMEDSTTPELQRSSLAEAVMLLKSMGVQKVRLFPLISPLPSANLANSSELLYALQAVDDNGDLTSSGKIMAQLNMDPRLSKILVSLETSSCTLEACRIVAMLQVKEIFVKPSKHISNLWSNTNLATVCAAEGDLPSYLNILNGFLANQKSRNWAEKRSLNYLALVNASEIAEKLEAILRRCGLRINSCKGSIEAIQRSLVSGLFTNAAYLHPCGDYKTIRGDQTVHIHPNSVFSIAEELPKHVVFVEVLYTTKTFIRHVMSIEQDWLLDAAPHFYSFATSIEISRRP